MSINRDAHQEEGSPIDVFSAAQQSQETSGGQPGFRPTRKVREGMSGSLPQEQVADRVGPGGPSSISQACKLPSSISSVRAEADFSVFGDDETAGDREQARSAASAGRKKQNPNVSRSFSQTSEEKCD